MTIAQLTMRAAGALLSEREIRVLRVLNDDVLCDVDAVLAAILSACGIEP